MSPRRLIASGGRKRCSTQVHRLRRGLPRLATTDAVPKVSAGIGRCSRQVIAMGRSPWCSTYNA
jgi:hypothetical protein